MKLLTLHESQQESLKILLQFNEICQKNNFKFFLIYGTLLGAIRHNGFIPWDDDIDVMMPRDDFDKFIQYSKDNEEALFPLKLCHRSNTKNYPYGIPRLVNTKFEYVIENNYLKTFKLGTFIDIYPLDNFGDNESEAIFLFNKCKEMNRYFSWYLNPATPKNFLFVVLKRILHFYMKLIKGDGYEKYIDDEIRSFVLSHTTKENRYAGLVVWASKVVLYEKSKLENLKTIDHIFEGHMFPIPKNFDYILKQSYNNYMQLPPEKDRKPYHGYKIYKR